MPHTVSFFLVAVFLWIWLRVRDRNVSRRGWFLLGVLGGAMMLARWQNAIFLLVPVVDLWVRRGRGESALTPNISKSVIPRKTDREREWLVFLAGAFVAFLPQLMAWQVIYGRPFLIPQGGDFLLWLRPKIHLLLFSRHNGLITWTPITLFGLIGLVQFARKPERRSLGIALIAVVAGQIYLNSIVVDWFAGMGFGMRRFVGMMPLLMVGLGAFIAWLEKKIRFYQVATLVGFFILWNALFLVQYYIPLFSRDRPITWNELFMDKIQIAQAVRRHSLQTAALVTAYRGNAGEAVGYAREAVSLGPHSPEARMTLALAYAKGGNRELAGIELEAAAEILGGTGYVWSRFLGMLRRAGVGGEVAYYEEVLRKAKIGSPSP